jgi:hypothetical protein
METKAFLGLLCGIVHSRNQLRIIAQEMTPPGTGM